MVNPREPVASWLRAAADRYADRQAVCGDGYSLTYRELEVRVQRYTAALRARGIRKGDLVALSTERSINLLAALLAVVRIGAVACPVDLRQAPERADRLLGALRPRMLLAEPGDFSLPVNGVAVTDLEYQAVGADTSCLQPPVGASGNELAYVAHTSGSTGRPKAVAVPACALANRIEWTQHRYPVGVGDVVMHAGSLAFDFYFWAALAPLCFGAAIALAPEGIESDPRRLAEFAASSRVSVAHFVPSLLAEFLNIADTAHLSKLRYVLCGGERLSAAVAGRLLGSAPAMLFNMYGPTETCIDMLDHVVTSQDLAAGSVPLGRPIRGTVARVLDAEGKPVAEGETGILYIGGSCLAWGYLGMGARTAAEFIPDSLSEVAGARLYRTGDLARQHPEGTFEFLGRVDDQVKIRGVRIEPADVEDALLRHPAVIAAAVTVDVGSGESALVAHLVADGADDDELRSFLASQLLVAAIPARFARHPSLPRLPSGKADRASLSRMPAPSQPPAGGAVVPLVTETERQVARIWSEVLRVEQIGRTSHFFDLGGQSLLAMRMIAKVRRDLGTKIPVRTLFDAPTVEGFSAELEVLRQEDPARATGQR